MAAQSRAVPGGVLVLYAKLGNTGDKPASATIVVTIQGFPEQQSGRKVSLEPGQREQFEIYVLLPQAIEDLKSIDVLGTVFVDYGGREVILDRRGTPATYSLTLGVSSGQTMAMTMPPEPPLLPLWFWPPPPTPAAYELTIASRVDAGKSRAAAIFDTRPLPLNQSDWEGIDLFIVAEPSVFDDAAGVEAIRRFLEGGGKVWVMLDRIPTQSVRPLLRAGQICEEIDQVELNQFSIDFIDALPSMAPDARTVSVEEAIIMKRVIQTGGKVTHSIDSWPVAITMDVGYGQLLLTTLDGQGWIEPRAKQFSDDPQLQSNYQVRQWGSYIVSNLHDNKAEPPLASEVDYPMELIGNPVVPRGQIALALLGFCGLLGGLGLWRIVAGDLSFIGIFAPAVALVFSLGLVAVASWIRRDIPESVSRLQIVEVAENGSFALGREQAAVYLGSSTSMQLKSNMDGRAMISSTVTSGIKRYQLDDFQQWQLSNSAWPPGTWRYRSDFAAATDDLVVTAELSPTGINLRLPEQGLPSKLEDPVLGYVIGDPMLCKRTTDGLTVDNRVSIDGERWSSGSLITDEQQRRINIYREYFLPDETLQRPTRRLYGWTTTWDSSHWSRELQQFGSSLVSLPVELQPPAVGQQVYIPHGLIQLRRNTTQMAKTSAFNDKTGKWLADRSLVTEAELELVLPPEVLPFSATSLELELDIKAPQRVVTISVPSPSGDVELAKLEGPSIAWRKSITDLAILKEAEDGILQIRIRIGDRVDSSGQAKSTNIVNWSIAHFHASFHGNRLPASSLSHP